MIDSIDKVIVIRSNISDNECELYDKKVYKI